MNERIQELADIVFINHLKENPDSVCVIRSDYINDLAQLILKECLGDFKDRIATRYQGSDKDRDIAYGMEIVYFDIIDKFGIEE